MAIQYISYERFLEDIRYSSNKNTRIKYNDKGYEFWYEKGKYCFRQYLPEIQNVQKFIRYEEMLNSVTIEGRSIKDLWDLNELEYFYRFPPIQEMHGYGYVRTSPILYFIAQSWSGKNKVYSSIFLENDRINVEKGLTDIVLNIPYVMDIWYLLICQVLQLIVFLFGMTSAFPIDGVSISYNFFVRQRTSLFLSHLLSLICIGFFTPLMDNAIDKIKGYFHSNYLLSGFILCSIVAVSINSCFSISIPAGIITFFVFILCDFISLCVGYFAYKIYYNRKLKEAERIREEYRREHPEENVG